MKQRTRIYYTEADKALMWERWRRGESLHAIARLFDRNHSAIGGILSRSGGIRPRPRRRSVRALALSEREEISRGTMAGLSARAIARSLRRAPSTVSREICRNGGRHGYRASEADRAAWDRAERPKRCKLAQNRALARRVAEKLRLQWSPVQVAGWLKRTYPARRDASGVPRDDLPHAVHPGPRGAEEGAAAAPQAYSPDAPLAPPHAEDTRPWPDQRDGVDPRAASRSRRSGGARSLGRGSVLWQPQQPGCQLSGAPDPLPHAGEGSRQGHRDRDRCAHQASPQAASRALQVADLGPWRRDGGPSTLLVGDRYQSLLLRSAAPMAAWLEREHQRSAAPVLPEGDELVGYQSEQAQCYRSSAKRTPTQDASLRDTGRTLCSMRCVDRLNPPSTADSSTRTVSVRPD